MLKKVQEYGLPDSLNKLKGSSDNPAVIGDTGDTFEFSDDPSKKSTVAGPKAANNLDMKTLKSILHNFAQPGLEKISEQQKMDNSSFSQTEQEG